jgi:hypothetical protein
MKITDTDCLKIIGFIVLLGLFFFGNKHVVAAFAISIIVYESVKAGFCRPHYEYKTIRSNTRGENLPR